MNTHMNKHMNTYTSCLWPSSLEVKGSGARASRRKMLRSLGVTRVLQECHKDIIRALQARYKGVTRVLQECFEPGEERRTRGERHKRSQTANRGQTGKKGQTGKTGKRGKRGC
jgi:signal recognition particle subunit SEC65